MSTDDQKIDTFLNSLPLAPVPGGFSRRLIARLEARKMPFRLEFLDLAVPAFIGLFAGLAFIAAAVMVSQPRPLWLVRLELTLRPLTWYLPDGLGLAVGILAVLLLIILVSLAGVFSLFSKTLRPG